MNTIQTFNLFDTIYATLQAKQLKKQDIQEIAIYLYRNNNLKSREARELTELFIAHINAEAYYRDLNEATKLAKKLKKSITYTTLLDKVVYFVE